MGTDDVEPTMNGNNEVSPTVKLPGDISHEYEDDAAWNETEEYPGSLFPNPESMNDKHPAPESSTADIIENLRKELDNLAAEVKSLERRLENK